MEGIKAICSIPDESENRKAPSPSGIRSEPASWTPSRFGDGVHDIAGQALCYPPAEWMMEPSSPRSTGMVRQVPGPGFERMVQFAGVLIVIR